MRARPDAETIDILPLLNVVVLLIPFTLLGASFVEIREISVGAPADGPVVAGVREPAVVDVFTDHLVVHGTLGPEAVWCGGPCGAEGRWQSEVAAALRALKGESGPERLVLRPVDDVPLGVAVAVMDAVRTDAVGELFPDIAFAGPPGP